MLSGRASPRDGVAHWLLRGATILCSLLLTSPLHASVFPPWPGPQQLAGQDLLVTVLDENGLAVSSARLTLTDQAKSLVQKAETDYAGRCQFSRLTPGVYSLRVEKVGFFVFNSSDLRVAETSNLEVTLNHTQEYAASVDVVYSPPAIDPQKTSTSAALSSQDIINLPYTVGRDIRYALPLLPGVLQDGFGQLHVAGASTAQNLRSTRRVQCFRSRNGVVQRARERGCHPVGRSPERPLLRRVWKGLRRSGEP